MDPVSESIRYLPDDYASPRLTAACILVVGIFGLFGLVFYLIGDALRRLRRAAVQRAVPAGGPLRLGPVVIAGTVEDEGGPPPIAIVIRQTGTEETFRARNWEQRSKHVWRETERAIRVKPFVVVRPSGERVRVEPDEDVVIAQVLPPPVALGIDTRTRTAQVGAGDRVYVSGVLTGAADAVHGDAYRGELGLPVVRPPRGAPMRISTEPPGERDWVRARADAALAAGAAGVLLLTHGVLLREYYALRFSGRVETARIQHPYTWHRADRHGTKTGYGATFIAPDGVFEADTSQALYASARLQGDRAEAPVLVSGPYRQVGSEPCCRSAVLIALVLIACASAAGVVAYFRSTRRWYERRSLRETRPGPLDLQTVTIR